MVHYKIRMILAKLWIRIWSFPFHIYWEFRRINYSLDWFLIKKWLQESLCIYPWPLNNVNRGEILWQKQFIKAYFTGLYSNLITKLIYTKIHHIKETSITISTSNKLSCWIFMDFKCSRRTVLNSYAWTTQIKRFTRFTYNKFLYIRSRFWKAKIFNLRFLH
jgi:hypothetical protein